MCIVRRENGQVIYCHSCDWIGFFTHNAKRPTMRNMVYLCPKCGRACGETIGVRDTFEDGHKEFANVV